MVTRQSEVGNKVPKRKRNISKRRESDECNLIIKNCIIIANNTCERIIDTGTTEEVQPNFRTPPS